MLKDRHQKTCICGSYELGSLYTNYSKKVNYCGKEKCQEELENLYWNEIIMKQKFAKERRKLENEMQLDITQEIIDATNNNRLILVNEAVYNQLNKIKGYKTPSQFLAELLINNIK